MIQDVEGYCPSCQQRTLHLMPDRTIQCLNHGCEDQGLAHRQLMANKPPEQPQLPIAVR